MRVEVEGKIIEFPDDLDPKEIERQLATLTASKSVEQTGKKIMKAIDLPQSIAAQTGALISDAVGGKSPLQALASSLGIGSNQEAKPRLTRPDDISRIASLDAPPVSEYFQRSGMSPGASEALGIATEVASPLDLINLAGAASKGARALGKTVYKYGLGPIGQLSEDVPEMLWKANKWGRVKKFKGHLEDLASTRSERIGKILTGTEEAGVGVNVAKLSKEPKYADLIHQTARKKAVSPGADWIPSEMEKVIDLESAIKKVGIDDPFKASPAIANKWKSELYNEALSNDPKTFEGMLSKITSGKRPGSESVGKIQKELALDVRDEIASELDKHIPGLGEEYLKVNKELGNIYEVKKPLDKITSKTGDLISEYDVALVTRVPQMVIAKKAYGLSKAPGLTTPIGIGLKKMDDILTGGKIPKTLFFNPYAYGTRKAASLIGKDTPYLDEQVEGLGKPRIRLTDI